MGRINAANCTNFIFKPNRKEGLLGGEGRGICASSVFQFCLHSDFCVAKERGNFSATH